MQALLRRIPSLKTSTIENGLITESPHLPVYGVCMSSPDTHNWAFGTQIRFPEADEDLNTARTRNTHTLNGWSCNGRGNSNDAIVDY